MINWTPGMKLTTIEREVILRALEFYRGNKTRTAESLGIVVRTLDNKLEEYQKQDEARRIKAEERTKKEAEQLRRARGLQAEPATPFTSEFDVPVRESEEVQKMSLKPNALVSPRKNNRRAQSKQE